MTRYKLAPALSMLVCIYFVFWCGENASTSANAASIQGSDKCIRDEQCPEGKFCYSVSHQCVPCKNCSKMMRHPARESNCARSKAECRPCLPGYRDSEDGNHCLVTTTTEATNNIKMETSSPLSTNINEHQSSWFSGGINSPLTWVVILIIPTMLVTVCVSYNRYQKRKNIGNSSPSSYNKRRDSDGEGRASLINVDSGNGYDSHNSPTAPPEEYNPPPCFNDSFNNVQTQVPILANYGSTSKKNLEDNKKQKALPFDAGNGSGDWARGLLARDNAAMEDVLDGNPPSPDRGNAVEAAAPVNNDNPVEHEQQEPAIDLQQQMDIEPAGGEEEQPQDGRNHLGGQQERNRLEAGFDLEVNFRFDLRLAQSRNARVDTVTRSQPWMSSTQMEIANPQPSPSVSVESIDSGVSSSGEPATVPDISNPIEVVMEEEQETI